MPRSEKAAELHLTFAIAPANFLTEQVTRIFMSFPSLLLILNCNFLFYLSIVMVSDFFLFAEFCVLIPVR